MAEAYPNNFNFRKRIDLAGSGLSKLQIGFPNNLLPSVLLPGVTDRKIYNSGLMFSAMRGLFAICLAGVLIQPAFSQSQQPKELSTEEVEVVKDFQPILADAVKVTFQPTVPSLETGTSKMKYYLPKKFMSLPYLPPAVKPLALKKETPGELPKGFLKTGYGNYSTIFVEALYNKGRSEWSNYGAYFKQHSSKSKSMIAQDFSHTRLNIFGKYFFNTLAWKNDLQINRDVLYFYGDGWKKTSKRNNGTDSLKQYFNFFEFNSELANYQPNASAIAWNARFKFDYLVNRFDAREWSPSLHIHGTKKFADHHQLVIGLLADHTRYDENISYELQGIPPTPLVENNYKRTLLAVHPVYKFVKNIFTLYGGINLTLENGTAYLFPDISTETKLLGDNLILYSGWERHLRKNSFRSLSNENPFVVPDVHILNSTVEDRSAGIKGSFSRNFSYNARFSQKIITDMPLFINDTVNLNKFRVIYDKKPQVIQLQAELAYQQSERVRFTLQGAYFTYEMDMEEKAWHLPAYQLNLSGSYFAWDKIQFTSELYWGGGIYARLKNGDAMQLNNLFDINFAANYFFSKNLTFFVNLNNVAMQKYSRWYRYPSYKENALLGVKVVF